MSRCLPFPLPCPLLLPVPLRDGGDPWSIGNVAMKLATEPGVLTSVSEDRETEWNEDTDEDCAWPDELRELSARSLRWSTVSESVRLGGYRNPG